jgi:hypothetical protein
MKFNLLYFFIFLLITPLNIQAKIVKNSEGCVTKKLQIMKPTFPSTDYQGYGIVTFNIKENGSVSKVRAKESQCAVSRNSDGSIKFKSCPFFKKSSVDAAKYLKYKPPLTEDGNPCILSSHEYRYTYRLYNVNFKDSNQFLFSNEVDLILKQNFESKEEEEIFLREIITGNTQ